MRPLTRVGIVFALAALVLAASKLIHFPHRDRNYLGPAPPSAGDVAWTGWALCGCLLVVGGAWLWWWWNTR